MGIGDTVVRKSYGKDITFRVIEIKDTDNEKLYILQGVNLRIEADSPEDDLEVVSEDKIGSADAVFNRRVNESIKNIINNRKMINLGKNFRNMRPVKNLPTENKDNLMFGRPGKVLHVDGDPRYMDVCVKVYKQLSIEAVGKIISEKDQPDQIVKLVKEVRPDIVVITGHDGMVREAKDFINLDNYRNSKHFVQSVINLREYEPNYDDLVIFAGACQSCYEAILDAGANYASSPGRVLIHCLDPVFVSEKVAYTNISDIVNIHDVIKSTITGGKGVGGLQTRGKYREGYPKSSYAK